jgi:hypothetical protein
MIKGTHRHMVILKNTESPLFEEAYFILRDQENPTDCRSDMVAEANRIITANTLPSTQKPKHEKIKHRLSFLLGALVGSGITAILFVIP